MVSPFCGTFPKDSKSTALGLLGYIYIHTYVRVYNIRIYIIIYSFFSASLNPPNLHTLAAAIGFDILDAPVRTSERDPAVQEGPGSKAHKGKNC